MTKALGMKVWFMLNPFGDPDNGYGSCWVEACATSIDGGGVESSMEETVPCLMNTIAKRKPGDISYSQQIIEYKMEYIEPNDANNDWKYNLTYSLRDLCHAKMKLYYCIKVDTIPKPTYAYRFAYVASVEEMSKDRYQDMKARVVLEPCEAMASEWGSYRSEEFTYLQYPPTDFYSLCPNNHPY